MINDSTTTSNDREQLLQLSNPDTLKLHQDYIDYLLTFGYMDRAYRVVKRLPELMSSIPDFRTTYPEIYKQYQLILIKAKGVALLFLSGNDILDLFSNHIKELLYIQDLDLMEKIEAKLVQIAFLDERDVFKGQLRDSLRRNQEFITSKSLVFGANRDVAPTIANWLRDYLQKVGTSELDKLKQAEYLVNDINIKELLEEEKEAVQRLFNLYDSIRLSSQTPQGLEETLSIVDDKGRTSVLRKGVEEVIPTIEEEPLFQKVASFFDEERVKTVLVDKYVVGALIDESFGKEIENIMNLARGDVSITKNLFYEALTKQDKVKSVSTLEILANDGALPDLLTDDRFSNLFLTYLKSSGNLQDVERLRVSPKGPQNVKGFIKFVLQDRLGFDENNAARFAIKIGNLLGDEYKEMAYFDASDQKFHWT